MTLICPGCDQGHRICCPLETPLAYLQNARRCQLCRSTLELLDHVIDYTESEQGGATFEISAVLRCPNCVAREVFADQALVSASLDLMSLPRLKISLNEKTIHLNGETLKDRANQPSQAYRRAFISYRRNGGAPVARLLRHELLMVGWYAFLDVEDLGAARFDDQLLREIEQSEVIIVVLSPSALDRCSDPNDWMRMEIAHALRLNKRLIPVCLEQFTYPEELPGEIAALPLLNCVHYSHQFFYATLERLNSFLT